MANMNSNTNMANMNSNMNVAAMNRNMNMAQVRHALATPPSQQMFDGQLQNLMSSMHPGMLALSCRSGAGLSGLDDMTAEHMANVTCDLAGIQKHNFNAEMSVNMNIAAGNTSMNSISPSFSEQMARVALADKMNMGAVNSNINMAAMNSAGPSMSEHTTQLPRASPSKLSMMTNQQLIMLAQTVRTATHCKHLNTLQHTAAHCSTLQHTATHCNTLQHTAAHCSALQHTATHYSTLQRTEAHCSTLQQSAAHCNALQHTAMHWNTLLYTATHSNTQQYTAAHRTTLQHTATHCSTQQHSSHCLPNRFKTL